jgi:hypothetical protein
MSIKPVDFQVMIPRTSEVSRISEAENHKSQVLLQQQAASTNQKVEHDLKQVYSQSKADEVRIRERQEKHQGDGKKNKKKDAAQEEKKRQSGDSHNSTIDIRL